MICAHCGVRVSLRISVESEAYPNIEIPRSDAVVSRTATGLGLLSFAAGEVSDYKPKVQNFLIS
jgi:hypothetical protein